jgi:hypothetical protein
MGELCAHAVSSDELYIIGMLARCSASFAKLGQQLIGSLLQVISALMFANEFV